MIRLTRGGRKNEFSQENLRMMRQSFYVFLCVCLLLCPLPLASQSRGDGNYVGNDFAGTCAGLTSLDQQNHGIDPANFDRSVAPCDNFYQFADGGWLKATPIPAAYSTWGSFNILQDHNQDILHDILEEAAKDKSAKPGSNWQKIGDFYATCMDEPQIEEAGTKPLQSEFDRIAAVHDAASLQDEIARLQGEGVSVVFGFGPQQDFKD